MVGPTSKLVNPLESLSAIAPAKVFVTAAKTCGRCVQCPEGTVMAVPTPEGVVIAVPIPEKDSGGSEDESGGTENKSSGSKDKDIGLEDIEPVATRVFRCCYSPVYSPEIPLMPPKQAQYLPKNWVYLYRKSVISNPGSSERRTTTTMKQYSDISDTHEPEGHLQLAVPWKYSLNKPFRDAFWRAFVADFLLWRNTKERHLPFKAPPPDNVRHWIVLALHRSTHGKMVDNIHNELRGNPYEDTLSRDDWSLLHHSLNRVIAGCPFVTAGGGGGLVSGRLAWRPGTWLLFLLGLTCRLLFAEKTTVASFCWLEKRMLMG